MKAKDFILIAIVVLGFAFLYVTLKRETKAERDRAVDSLYQSHEVLINFDSVESAITQRIVDSVFKVIEPMKADLKKVRRDNDQLRKDNAELYEKYQRLGKTDRPTF